ncbi:MAG TPA: hypothetical protein VF469_39740 [Kofleriaceae bacterium]
MRDHRLLVGSVYAALAALAPGACTSSDHYLTVTVDARPAVHDARAIAVSLSNSGTTRMDSLALRAPTFPVTFSISAPGRTGDLAIAVDATDDSGTVVGHGTAMTTVSAATASVVLDSTDFVVNTDYAGDQFPSSDFEANGFQLAALPDGTWTTAFRDDCPSNSCNLFARRFDKAGKPVSTQAAAGTNAFALTGKPTTNSSTPAIASSQTATVAIWDAYDPDPGTGSGVACRAIDAAGNLGAAQTSVAPDAADVASVTAMSNGNFVATWKTVLHDGPAPNTDYTAIRMAIVKPDCSIAIVPTTLTPVATPMATPDLVRRSSVASSRDKVLFAWITYPNLYGDLHTRMASNSGGFSTVDTVLISQTATEEVVHARVAPALNGGFVIAVRWAQKAGTGPGRIDLYQVNAAGALVGMPTLVTDQSGSDFSSSESFGLASRPDGSVMVAWHVCDMNGEACTLSGRILKDTGAAVTDAFAIPTTTGGSQKRPSVVGLPDAFAVVWSDTSDKPPDTSKQAVRARIIYPPGTP